MANTPFQVIRGGLLAPINEKNKRLEMAYVTDTRLMGVLVIHAHWQLVDEREDPDFHQFFYIDCEEFGLETYMGIRTDDLDDTSDVKEIEQSLVGGLGAKKIPLNAAGLASILQYYADFNAKRALALPPGSEEFQFLLDANNTLKGAAREKLISKICGPIYSNYQVINYFLMRCFGQDYKAASRLVSGDFAIDLYKDYVRTSFCKNVIDLIREHEDGTCEYMCESLVERSGQYELIVSRLFVRNVRITGFSHCSGFKVSFAEAAMMLAKPEYVTVYEVLLDDEDIENNIGELTITFNTIMSQHASGKLFMAYKDNNSHVDSNHFMLSNDVMGIYYLTDLGQLIAAAYTLPQIKNMENKLRMSPLGPYLMTTGRYEFKEPIVYEFINSNFEDFDDFLDAIRQ